MREHIPVLLREVRSYAGQISSLGNALDCTLGLGGHSKDLLKTYPNLSLFAIDADNSVREDVDLELRSLYQDRFRSAHLNFSEIERLSDYFGAETPSQFDLILADLGISSAQLDDPERGLSYRYDAPLDMRLDSRVKFTAADILNNCDERELLLIFKRGGLGPERSFLVKEIIKRRPVNSTYEFKDICEVVYFRDKQRRRDFSSGHNSLSLPFQALRIAVNNELLALTNLLLGAIKYLAEGGLLIVISFHSGEDTLVTRAMRWWASQRGQGLHEEDAALGKLLTAKAVVPSNEEIDFNPRSRSARLRVFQRGNTPLWKERALLPTNYPLQ